MQKWQHIDFHLHTLPNEELDNQFSFSMDWLKEYTSNLNLDAIAITNHDFLDIQNFKQIQKELNGKVKIFPGAEVKLKGGHILIIDEPKNIQRIHDSLMKLKNIHQGNGLPNEEEFIMAFPYFSELLIIKDAAKSKSYNPESEDSKLEKAFSAGDSGSAKAFNRLKKSDSEVAPVLFGDHHATYDDEDKRHMYVVQKTTYIKVSELKIASFKLSLKNKENVSLLPNKKIENPARFFLNGKSVVASDSENLVLGRRGTGKTHLIEDLLHGGQSKTLYIKQGELVQDSNQEEFSKRLKSDNQATVEEYFNAYQSFFNEIVLLRQMDDFTNSAENFLQSIKEFGRQIKNSDESSKVPLFSDPKSSKHYKSVGISGIQKALDSLLTIKQPKYAEVIYSKIGKEKLQDLKELFASEKALSDKFNKLYEVTESTRRSVKKELSKISSTDAPDSDNFKFMDWFARKERIRLFNFAAKNSVVRKHIILEKKVGEYFTLRISARPFKTAQEILNQTARKFPVQDLFTTKYLKEDYWGYLDALLKNDQLQGIQLWELLLKVDYQLLNDEGNPASGGQRAEYDLLKKLDLAYQYDLVLIDEPEGSFDNPFLTSRLLPTIDQISSKTTTFVITHSSSVGSLLNPNFIFITRLVNGEYQILTGDFDSGKLINIESQEEELIYDSMIELMEAGDVNFDRKGDVYESLNSFR